MNIQIDINDIMINVDLLFSRELNLQRSKFMRKGRKFNYSLHSKTKAIRILSDDNYIGLSYFQAYSTKRATICHCG